MKNPNHIPQEEFERIEQYIFGNISAEESDAFELEMESDNDLRKKYLEVKTIISGLEEAALREDLEIFHKEMEAPTQRITTNRSINYWPWAAAAAIFLCIVAAVWTIYPPTPSHERLFAQFYQEDPGLITAMSSASNYEFDRAMVDYKSGKYEEAIVRWEKLIQNNPENDTLQYFLGASNLALKKADPAIFYLNSFVSKEESAFYEDATWYLALAYLLGGKVDEAINMLNQSQNPQTAKLLKELEKL
ncbi:tetratricopeptide repeat protein [Mongoliibacter ruber]|uniref:Uncharacterized protein n=1 Tax=Mongoliibacter ruber TaxID=1750599 RepID=A0A2T0WT39_9BACT|nr:tetratricopeptide repeat protein [Mongoliibacter ruber]PRY89865.1 hypothetical protein CLW00_102341 [Mongoliibacter ruber]